MSHSDLPIGVTLRGRDEIRFLQPYRHIGKLNEVELAKLARHPYEAVQAVLDRYAQEGPQAIEEVPGEAERLKWAGIYPQRQGGNAFMMRVKVPGGRLSAEQAVELGVLAEAFAQGPQEHPVFGGAYLDLTTRQDIQLHWVRIEDVPRIWRRLDAVGLTTIQACGDSARNVVCCPIAGADPGEVVDALPIAVAISNFFTGNRTYANLPRKFKMCVTGCREDCVRAEINDIALWPARAADDTMGFNLLVGGGLSDGERMASDVDVFVAPEDAVEICRAIAQLYGELGNRENRGLARMRYLVEELGPEGFREELAARAACPLPPRGEGLTTCFRSDHVGISPDRRSGRVIVGLCVPVGRLKGRELSEAGRLAATYGDGLVRLGADQNLMLAGILEELLEDLLAEPLLSRCTPFPGPFTRGAVACTGTEFCRFAVVETKLRALELSQWLDQRLGAELAAVEQEALPIRVHLSGCSASCAQPQTADVGLRGAAAHKEDQLTEGVDVGLGGTLGPEAGFADWVLGGLAAEDLPVALERLVRAYLKGRKPKEPLWAWARRQEPASLQELLSVGSVREVGK
jgi:ferredoxin-nitrite reductase